MNANQLAGVYAAAVTPLTDSLSPDPDGLLSLLDFLAVRGCHGALLMGTTGEGPSLSIDERMALMRAAARIRETHPDFRLLAGVGMPALDDTVQLARFAFDQGFNAVVVLPPYYFRGAAEDGLFAWFREVILRGVPQDGALLGYHIPGVSGVPLSLDLLVRLRDACPEQFLGIKDSSADRAHALALGERFGADLFVLNGTDRLFTEALEHGASGCITAMGNLVSPDLRAVFDRFQEGKRDPAAQQRLNEARAISERFPPAAPLIKYLLSAFHDFPRWPVKPPLLPLDERTEKQVALAWRTRGKRVD